MKKWVKILLWTMLGVFGATAILAPSIYFIVNSSKSNPSLNKPNDKPPLPPNDNNNNNNNKPNPLPSPILSLNNTNLNDQTTINTIKTYYKDLYNYSSQGKWEVFQQMYKTMNVTQTMESVQSSFIDKMVTNQQFIDYMNPYVNDLKQYTTNLEVVLKQSFNTLNSEFAKTINFYEPFVNKITSDHSVKWFKNLNNRFVRLFDYNYIKNTTEYVFEQIKNTSLFTDLINKAINNNASLFQSASDAIYDQAIKLQINKNKQNYLYYQKIITNDNEFIDFNYEQVSNTANDYINFENAIMKQLGINKLFPSTTKAISYYQKIFFWYFISFPQTYFSKTTVYDIKPIYYVACSYYCFDLYIKDAKNQNIVQIVDDKYNSLIKNQTFLNQFETYIKSKYPNQTPDYKKLCYQLDGFLRTFSSNYFILNNCLNTYNIKETRQYAFNFANNLDEISTNLEILNQSYQKLATQQNFNDIITNLKTYLPTLNNVYKLIFNSNLTDTTLMFNNFNQIKFNNWANKMYQYYDYIDSLNLRYQLTLNTDIYIKAKAKNKIFKTFNTTFKSFNKGLNDFNYRNQFNNDYYWTIIFNSCAILLTGSDILDVNNNLFNQNTNNYLGYYLCLNILNELCKSSINNSQIQANLNTSIATYDQTTNSFKKSDRQWLNDLNNKISK